MQTEIYRRQFSWRSSAWASQGLCTRQAAGVRFSIERPRFIYSQIPFNLVCNKVIVWIGTSEQHWFTTFESSIWTINVCGYVTYKASHNLAPIYYLSCISCLSSGSSVASAILSYVQIFGPVLYCSTSGPWTCYSFLQHLCPPPHTVFFFTGFSHTCFLHQALAITFSRKHFVSHPPIPSLE